MTGTDILLRSLLGCGTLELAILEDVQYDLGEIADDLMAECGKITLNMITNEIFQRGVCDLKEKLEDKIKYLQSKKDDFDEKSCEFEELQEQIDILESLDPDEDIKWYCNYLDTSIYFCQNLEVYREYLENEISDVEYDMGFSILS